MRGVRCLAGEGREADARGGAGDGNGAAGIGRGGKRGLQRCAEGGRKRRRGERRAEKKDSGCAGILLRYSGRSDWIRTSDPLLPKQVRYHAAPRSVMGCFVRKRPCFGKGGPSGGQGRCLPEGKAASCGTGPQASLTRQADDDRGQGSIYR